VVVHCFTIGLGTSQVLTNRFWKNINSIVQLLYHSDRCTQKDAFFGSMTSHQGVAAHVGRHIFAAHVGRYILAPWVAHNIIHRCRPITLQQPYELMGTIFLLHDVSSSVIVAKLPLLWPSP